MKLYNIKISEISHKHLYRIGRKDDTFDSIIIGLIQEHIIPEMEEDFQKIQNICKDQTIENMTTEEITEKTRSIFQKIGFDYGIYPELELSEVVESTMNDDGDELSLLTELVVHIYCWYLAMPSPTFR